jgi:hypothetical protein
MPSRLKSIGAMAFYGCSLTNVEIPNFVTNVDFLAFLDCKGLTNVVFGDAVSVLGSGVFTGCDALRTLYFAGDAPRTDGYLNVSIEKPMVYYMAGTKGWSTEFAGWPTTLWRLPYPLILKGSASTS